MGFGGIFQRLFRSRAKEIDVIYYSSILLRKLSMGEQFFDIPGKQSTPVQNIEDYEPQTVSGNDFIVIQKSYKLIGEIFRFPVVFV